jgi:hypothetical protein
MELFQFTYSSMMGGHLTDLKNIAVWQEWRKQKNMTESLENVSHNKLRFSNFKETINMGNTEV